MPGLITNVQTECLILFCVLAIAVSAINFYTAFVYNSCYAHLENDREHLGPYWAKIFKKELFGKGMFWSYIVGFFGCEIIIAYGNWFYPGFMNYGVMLLTLLAILFLVPIGFGVGYLWSRRRQGVDA